MATRAWNLDDYGLAAGAVPVARPPLRLVEADAGRPPRPLPPSWMIAPLFRGEPPVGSSAISVHEPQADYRLTGPGLLAPYRTVREVPRSAS